MYLKVKKVSNIWGENELMKIKKTTIYYLWVLNDDNNK